MRAHATGFVIAELCRPTLVPRVSIARLTCETDAGEDDHHGDEQPLHTVVHVLILQGKRQGQDHWVRRGLCGGKIAAVSVLLGVQEGMHDAQR